MGVMRKSNLCSLLNRVWIKAHFATIPNLDSEQPVEFRYGVTTNPVFVNLQMRPF